MEFHHIVPHDADMEREIEGDDNPESPDPPVWSEVLAILYLLNMLVY